MKELLEDYRRRLKTVNEMIANTKADDSITLERLNTKAGDYRTFIVELERCGKDE